MSNETHNDSHHENHGQEERAKSKTAFTSSFWFVIILVGLFIAAMNFIEVESKAEGNEKEKVEAKQEAATPREEIKKDEARTDTANAEHSKMADTTHMEKH